MLCAAPMPATREDDMTPTFLAAAILSLALIASGDAQGAEICRKFGPQAPRDIADGTGTNPLNFSLALPAAELNLCNMHFHAHAEHKGPGFARPAADAGEHDGFQCNGTQALSADERTPLKAEACNSLRPGDSVEVHWVCTSCDVTPGAGLASCMSPECANPVLRVESQVFLLTNGGAGADFADFDYAGGVVGGVHQPKGLPGDSGMPVVFRGSTGPDFTQETCSPLQVTWSVRPDCAKLDIASLGRWCESNPFGERRPHGVRRLVTAPELLSKIE
jgi:hypothetical protein